MSHSSATQQTPRLWAIVPAAGVGSRMQADRPKQYLQIAGKAILQLTLERLQQSYDFEKIVVALNPSDPYWQTEIDNRDLNLLTAQGGQERCDSVLNALNAIRDQVHDDDWVLVHDAARPCVRAEEIQQAISELTQLGIGGLLAAPVKDTMKRSDADGAVAATVEREGLWHALTPQIFPYYELHQALSQALDKGVAITDEAMAIEQAGGKAKLVKGSLDNIKITRPEDLKLAELYLKNQKPDRTL